MSDENKELSFTISTKAELAGAAATAQSLEMQIGKAKALGKDYSELSDQLKRVRTAMDEADPSAKTVGETVEKTTGQSRAFHTVLGELNRLIPGLGHALHPVAEAYIESGHAAEAGAEGTVTFTEALGGLLETLGPIIAIGLAIEAISKYWDMYKESAEAAAKAQEEATKRIVDSTKEALKAVQELNAELNPKSKTLAEHDDEKLKHQLEQLDELAAREKALNTANKENALAAATTPEQKKAVETHFAELDKALEVWKEKQKAVIEGAVADAMNMQIGDMKDKVANLTGQLGEQFKIMSQAPGEIKDLQDQKAGATTTVVGPNGIPYQVPDQTKVDALDKQIADKQAQLDAANAEYNRIKGEVDAAQKSTGELSEKAADVSDRAGDDAGKADYTQGTNAAVAAVRLTGRAGAAIKTESSAQNLQEAQAALADAQAVGRDLRTAVITAHASNSDTYKQLLQAYEALIAQNTRMMQQIAAAQAAANFPH
jgi:hypothetical protein